MTILTLRRIRDDRFEVTGPDIEPVTFKNPSGGAGLVPRALPGLTDPRGWRPQKGTPAAVVATAELAEILERRPDLKGRSLAAVKQILRRETRLSLRPLRTSKTQK